MTENPTIARLDRAAAKEGIELSLLGKNSRGFELSWTSGRSYAYKPKGKGTVLLEAFVNGELEAYYVCGPDRVIRLWRGL